MKEGRRKWHPWGEDSFHYAATAGNAVAVQQLLELNGDWGGSPSDTFLAATPLMLAAAPGHNGYLQLLISNGSELIWHCQILAAAHGHWTGELCILIPLPIYTR